MKASVSHIEPMPNAKKDSRFFFQPKLTVNRPDDVYERQADAMADHVLTMPAADMIKPSFFKPAITNINRKCSHCEEEEKVQRKDAGGVPAIGENYALANIVQRIPVPTTGTSTGQTQTSAPVAATPVARRQMPTGPISRAEFENYVMHNFNVGAVRTGTQQEQEQSLTRNGSPAPSISNWQSWSPADPSEDYSFIIKAIEDVASTFGAVPNITDITFYQMYYTLTGGVAVADPHAGASFGAGHLDVFRAFGQDHTFPVARSSSAGSYPSVFTAVGSPGSSAGAPSPLQSREQNISENIAHELGHGISEAAYQADAQVFTNFGNAVGWVGTSPALLYDVGQSAVQTAISSNTTPPAQYQIAPDHWNDPQWIEQPMTYYSVAGGLGEDFAESIAAYIYARVILQARSPRRYQFIVNGMNSWTARMHALPAVIPPAPVGDFPVTEQIRHTA